MEDPFADYRRFMAEEGVMIAPEQPTPRRNFYYIYVLSQNVPLFMANHFQPTPDNKFPVIQGYTNMYIVLPHETSKSALIKRIYKFYPHTGFIIPPQRLNNKIWNRSNKQ